MEIRNLLIVLFVAICLVGGACLSGSLSESVDNTQIVDVDKSQIDNDILSVLRSLQPLSKPLFSWGIVVFKNVDFLDEWVRITHTCPLSFEWSSEERIRVCAEMLAQYPNAKISMNYSPMLKYYNVFRKSKNIGFTEMRNGIKGVTLDPVGSGGVWDSERSFVERRLVYIEMIFREFDIDLTKDVRSIAMLDHEYAIINDETTDVLIEKLNWMYDEFESHGHHTFYYNFRCQRPDSQSKTGWDTWKQVPEKVHSRWASCSMYWPSQLYMNREILRRTVDYSGTDVIPFISLGWEWEHKVNQVTGKISRVANIVYDTGLSFVLGMDLHIGWRPEPDERVPFIFCWPGVGHNEFFWDHFIAYVNGANFRLVK